MKHFFQTLMILICGLLGPQPSQAIGDSAPNETLIVIGYADENHVQGLKGVFMHEYFFTLAQRVESSIQEELVMKGYNPDPHQSSRWIHYRSRDVVTVLNSNFQCPNENPQKALRGRVCPEQIQQSEKLKIYLEQNIRRFNRFIYIGHSRLGLGLGIGPFYSDQFTFTPRFFNQIEAGRLQQVLIASCDSERYYAKNFAHRSGIQFTGTIGPLRWVEDLLPMVLHALN